jgi:hypothetical protein
MAIQDRVSRLAEALEETAAAHHEAFKDTDGYDPEWATWYARHLHEEGFLRDLKEAELAARLRTLAVTDPPSEPWALFYAQHLID